MSNSVSMALALAPPMMMPLFMFGGFFVNTEYVKSIFHLPFTKHSGSRLKVFQDDLLRI